MDNLLEVFMVICFGVSWPVNIARAWRARSTKGSSLLFYCLIWVGYLFGIASKVLKAQAGVPTPFYVWFFYVLNLMMISVGIAVYFRNRRLDRLHE